MAALPTSTPSAPIALVPAPSRITLYEAEEQLTELLDTAELVPPDQEAPFLEELRIALNTAVEKRDRIGHFMAHLESQAELAEKEIARLKERKASYTRVLDRLESYILRIIEERATPGKGGKLDYPKLEGNVVTLSRRGCAASVEITNEAQVPATYKKLEITIPATVWEQVLETVPAEDREWVLGQISKSDCQVSKTGVKLAIEAGKTVPGARLVPGRYLVRK